MFLNYTKIYQISPSMKLKNKKENIYSEKIKINYGNYKILYVSDILQYVYKFFSANRQKGKMIWDN